jgi:signal transduction histidine kinase
LMTNSALVTACVLATLSAFAFGQPSSIPLTTARSIRDLSPEQAEARQPVRLTATVTVQPPDRTIFLQDATGGTFIRSRADNPLVQSGQVITVDGFTVPGLYVPGIDAKNIRVTGTAELPTPTPLTFEQLAAGQFHYQWVEVTGIVRSVTTSDRGTVLTLALGDGQLELYFSVLHDAAHSLVDARVRAAGLAAGSINDRRQLVAPHLRMRGFDDVQLIDAAPVDPFAIAATPIQELLRFAPDGRAGHRVKVRGVVTHTDGDYVYLREGSQGLRVRGKVPEGTVAGSEIEALGFPEMGRFTAFLADAECRIAAQIDPPVPVDVKAKAILAGTFDADLVRLEATLLEVLRTADAQHLLMEAEDAIFSARLPANETLTPAITNPGTRLRLTGVCSIAQAELQPRGFRSAPRSFELLLRAPGDVELLRAAPWWTKRRLTIASLGLLALVLATLAWVALLRRQVRRQTTVIEQKLHDEAVVEERQRIAREFHDTLEQELIGLSLRLDALATQVTDEKPRDLLGTARRLLQRLQNEARGFVWDLRRSALGPDDITQQIRQALTSTTETGAVQIEITPHGESRHLSGIVEHNLVRIAQEAVTNAIKHGHAKSVAIDLHFEPDRFILKVRDDGSGFDPSAGEQAGHFGLIGIRERSRNLGGLCEIHSAPAQGTSVEITVYNKDTKISKNGR